LPSLLESWPASQDETEVEPVENPIDETTTVAAMLRCTAVSDQRMKEAARLRRPLSEFSLTNGDDVANRNGGLGPIRNDDLDHRDGPSRGLG
jgi:hypothetical protein